MNEKILELLEKTEPCTLEEVQEVKQAQAELWSCRSDITMILFRRWISINKNTIMHANEVQSRLLDAEQTRRENLIPRAIQDLNIIEEGLGNNLVWLTDQLDLSIRQGDRDTIARLKQITRAWELVVKVVNDLSAGL